MPTFVAAKVDAVVTYPVDLLHSVVKLMSRWVDSLLKNCRAARLAAWVFAFSLYFLELFFFAEAWFLGDWSLEPKQFSFSFSFTDRDFDLVHFSLPLTSFFFAF